ncbi:hypothetical protein GCM10027445_58610 [Amycolatopsis endophytica]
MVVHFAAVARVSGCHAHQFPEVPVGESVCSCFIQGHADGLVAGAAAGMGLFGHGSSMPRKGAEWETELDSVDGWRRCGQLPWKTI